MDSDPPVSKPEVPTMPLNQLLEASDELPASSKMRKALVILVMKIDKGFSAMLFYMRSIRERVATVAREHEQLAKRVRSLEDELATFRSQREADKQIDAAVQRENTAKHRLAQIQGKVEEQEKRESKAEKRQHRQDEWKKLNLRWKIAVIAGLAGFLTAIATGTFKVLEVLIPLILGGGGDN